ncbi:MAG: hypothetical protein V1944_00975 [Candidatus Aenigmatarchaeota archaeon]
MSWLTKIGGGIVFFFGLIITIGFPWILEYQNDSMGKFGITFGLVLMGIGVWLMLM